MLTIRPADSEGRQAGFSVVEMLVVTALTLIVGGIVLSSTISGFRTTQKQTSRVEALNDVKSVFQRLTRDIRGANPVIAAEANRIQVREIQSGVRRTLEWVLDGDQVVFLQEEVDHTTGVEVSPAVKRVVLRDVEMPAGTPVFRYFAADGSELAETAAGTYPVDEIESVELALAVGIERSDETVEMSERITVRNQL
jgi:type II secretory pathway pseudopilin PulG